MQPSGLGGDFQRGQVENEFRRIASDVSQGLAAIHREGLVHGDLKPGNVMINDERAVILDFSLAQKRSRTVPHVFDRLVSFSANTPQHLYARAYLKRRDGLTGLLRRPYLESIADDEALFAEWAACTMTVASYALRCPNPDSRQFPTILELLTLRTAALRAQEQTEHYLMSLLPVVIGLTGPLSFSIVMVGPSLGEAQQIVELAKGQADTAMPDLMSLEVAIRQVNSSQPGRSALANH